LRGMTRTKTSEGRRAAAREVWEGLVTDHAASGQSVEAFCRSRRVSASALRYWIAKRKMAESPLRFVSAVKVGHAAVGSLAEKATGVLVEVGGATIRVEPGFDRGLLLEVVRAIGGAR
jgi:hypothetical protein